MDPIREIPKKFTKKSGNKVINRQYFRRKTGLKSLLSKSIYCADMQMMPCEYGYKKRILCPYMYIPISSINLKS